MAPPARGVSSSSDAVLQRALVRLRGLPIEYDLRPYRRTLARIDDAGLGDLSTVAITDRAVALAAEVRQGRLIDTVLPEFFGLAREACVRALGLRPFDVQMLAAIALHHGRIAQMNTGEGKTLAAVLPAALNALGGTGVHVLTANDYLARRDAAWMAPAYRLVGLRAAAVWQGMGRDERREAYLADVTYVTAKEAGFDFLRDQLAVEPAERVQRPYNYVIVDEADFILIDEARVPLVIAGMAPAPPVPHEVLAAAVRDLQPGAHFVCDEHARNVSLTDAGFRELERRLGCRPLHLPAQQTLLAGIHVAVHACALLHRDRDYIVRGGRIDLVDEFTGRVAENRRWPHGIQPAIEAKEGVEVQPEGQVLGSIPLQHFVRLWPKIAGMTATAEPSAVELFEFYGLKTVVFPPHRPCVRTDEDDAVFTHRAAKVSALVEEIAAVHRTGRPILVGTASVAESEELAAALRRDRVKCRVLNARHDAREALIVSRAGTRGAVTISTNMAGRGTDIVLGAGDPAARDIVAALGGLYVIGTNRHESRRVDDQLRGRAGRQGDPGSSRFFVSLEDDLIRRYGVLDLIPRGHRPSPQPGALADPAVAEAIARAQRVIEGQNFEIRKTLWRYSAMVEEQRLMLARRREDLFEGRDVSMAEEAAPGRHAQLTGEVGAGELRDAERRLALLLLDRRWCDHLALIDDIREGIHLQRYAGRQPITEFQREIIGAYAAMLDGWRAEVVETFLRLRSVDGRIDLEAEGIRRPTSTWTYLVNDNPLPSFGLRLIAQGNAGVSLATAMLAMMYWPVTIVVVATTFVRRWLRRQPIDPV
jgi:preprotein translocase subunit SecA